MKPKVKQFRGWRQLGPKDILRSTDRWTYSPEHFRSPAGMFEIRTSLSLRARRRLGSEQLVVVYRREET